MKKVVAVGLLIIPILTGVNRKFTKEQIPQIEYIHDNYTHNINELTTEKIIKLAKIKSDKKYEVQVNNKLHTASRGKGINKGTFRATAYDLSYQSCGKKPSHPAYGITANGTNLKGQTLESARAIAVDPKVIPLGSKVYLEFEDEYKHLNGVYNAVDTGGAIKGKRIDIFFGSGDVSKEVKQFGVRKVKVTLLSE